MHTKSPALPHRSLRLQPRSINESFTAQERQWQRLMAQNAVDEAQERTKAYLPQIQAALDKLKSQSETPPPLIADAELYTGKVRDVYKPNKFPQHVVLAATGRQSAFDRALATVPFKGAVLNQVSRWWFETTKDICENHVRASPLPDVLVAARCQAFPVEFVVRGYITGSTSTSLWTHYKNGERTYCGIDFPDGLVKNQKLAENVCTPTTKDAEHDEPISGEDIVSTGRMTQAQWDECRGKALAIFARGQEIAASRGLVLVDTKFEFGLAEDGTCILIDEVLTPDSSRYWLAHSYEARHAAGQEPENIDKEFLRLWYRERCDPYKDEVIPAAPDELVCELSRRYILLYELITGETFDFQAASAAVDRPAVLAECLAGL